jgi:type II secretory pathway pseudopilin PulG
MLTINKNDAFTYITALIFVMVIGISLTTGSAYWSTIVAREKEKELLFRGDQIRRAIESYYNGAPGGGSKQYPASLNDLLKDSRYLATRRYLRKIYKDPVTKDGQWGLIKAPGGRIKGVFSHSREQPIKVGDFPQDYASFENAGKYSDWRFVYPLEVKTAGPSAGASKGTKADMPPAMQNEGAVQEETETPDDEQSESEGEDTESSDKVFLN